MVNASSMERFFNCTVPWFGPFCQYNFRLNHSFSDIVKFTFADRDFMPNTMNLSCYVYLECNRGPSPLCLDWREICDGKVDCLDGGEDEKYCLELETNQCAENEYQCRNGMCVDKAFLLDDYARYFSPECLDWTDEVLYERNEGCWKNATFTCEDTICRSPVDFACGDGQCITMPIISRRTKCGNQRDRVFDVLNRAFGQETTPFGHCLDLVVCGTYMTTIYSLAERCKTVCKNKQECEIRIRQYCPSAFSVAAFPVWDSHVRLGYFFNQTRVQEFNIMHDIVCYNQHQCPFLTPTLQVDNYTCRHIHELNLTSLDKPYTAFLPCAGLYQSGNETHCREPSMLRCPGTNTCIPKRRIMDGIPDCYDGFDESVSVNSCELNNTYHFKCTSENKCLSLVLVGDRVKQCLGGEDEIDINNKGLIAHIRELPFSALCDNRTDMVSSGNETDETHCEQWSCVNQYTRCNEVWQCPKGMDELNCRSRFNCPADHHPCFFPKNNTLFCLHVNHTDDGVIDCLGATDERNYCRLQYPNAASKRYRCWNKTECVNTFDRCYNCMEFDIVGQLCDYQYDKYDDMQYYLSKMHDGLLLKKLPFSPQSSSSFPTTRSLPPVDKREHDLPTQIDRFQGFEVIDNRRAWLCNRGIAILVGKNGTEQCLCPPSYYGHRCQYQNQRVSLTLRLRTKNVAKFDVIGIVITLVDHTGIIHSHDQFTYIPIRDCNTKFNVYLLYQDRPKDMMKNYTIHADAYDKGNLVYLASWTLPIKFPFMPVNRVSAQLTIPAQRTATDWLGANSIVRHECNCSSDSICVGFANNRSICLCPLTKIGPRCLLDSVCQQHVCMNGSLCVPEDERDSLTNFVCLCPDGFSGKMCNEKDVKIGISFSGVAIPQSLLIHFITAREFDKDSKNPMPVRATTFKKIPLDQDTVTFYMSLPFHLVFAQIENTYYLVVLQHKHIPSDVIPTEIMPSQHCPHIRELFDELTVSYPALRRVKYYHIPCNERSDLVCFHDNDTFMCLCTEERNANCFHFDFNKTYKCLGSNNCENEAQCFQDHPTCPTKTMCVCEECFYGTKCQFTTKGFGLSLDAILGYQIHPRLAITRQSTLVKVSITVATLMLVVGLISGTLSIFTFQTKLPRQVGCGLYLLASSITSILIIIVFNLKLWLLILSQMSVITSRSLLLFNCISIDFILRLLLAIADWFNACVAVERVLTVVFDINFDKTKSKRAARWVILAVPLFTVASVLHDPIHRRLIDDEEEGRTWCLARFTRSVEIFNSVINISHFIIPFSLNLISAISIVVIAARKRSSVQKQHTYKEHLKEQFRHHQHLILSPIVLVVLALPRLIIGFMSGCMKSARDPKLFLVGYFISFIPPLLPFFIFVLPSKMYMEEFKTPIRRRWKAFRRRLNPE